MKAKIVLLLSLATFFSMFPAKASIPECEEWYALIVCASTRPQVFRANSNYLYHILSEHYSFKDIMYLSCHYGDPGVDWPAMKDYVRWAITDYLKNQVDSKDVVITIVLLSVAMVLLIARTVRWIRFMKVKKIRAKEIWKPYLVGVIIAIFLFYVTLRFYCNILLNGKYMFLDTLLFLFLISIVYILYILAWKKRKGGEKV